MSFETAKTFPYESEKDRLFGYKVNSELLKSDHFSAYAIQGETDFTQRYNRLRYIVANFNGLVAKVSADMLFGEDVSITVDKNQDFIDGLMHENELDVQLLESALSNSALGDAVFRIRVVDNEIKIEDIDPSIYFPVVNLGNPRQKPEIEELAWVEKWQDKEKNEVKFLVREIHSKGFVETRIFVCEGDENYIVREVDVNEYNAVYGTNYIPLVETNIEKSLLIHIPNFRYIGSKDYFGTSDFLDLNTLQFELNNRLTKVANILDKHSDPILAVPDGVLNDDGTVKKEAMGMVELGDDGEVPQYIVWNANLESAFNEIDKMVDFLFMMSETSPDVLGLGKNQSRAESGRALRLRLIRTIAKIKRKQRYYLQGLKELFETCQLLSKYNKGVGITYNDKKFTVNEIESVEIKFSDGVVNDIVEETDVAIKRIDAGIMSPRTAIKLLDGISDEEVDRELEVINENKADFTSIIDNLARE